MQFEMTKKIGQTVFTIKEIVKDHCEFVKLASFFQELPQVGPGGETDLRLSHRSVKGYEFYSLVTDSGGMEYSLGQYKEHRDGFLYCKREWKPVYNKESAGASGAGKTPEPATQVPEATTSEEATAKKTDVMDEYL